MGIPQTYLFEKKDVERSEAEGTPWDCRVEKNVNAPLVRKKAAYSMMKTRLSKQVQGIAMAKP